MDPTCSSADRRDEPPRSMSQLQDFVRERLIPVATGLGLVLFLASLLLLGFLPAEGPETVVTVISACLSGTVVVLLGGARGILDRRRGGPGS